MGNVKVEKYEHEVNPEIVRASRRQSVERFSSEVHRTTGKGERSQKRQIRGAHDENRFSYTGITLGDCGVLVQRH
jgi:hypothetical protein